MKENNNRRTIGTIITFLFAILVIFALLASLVSTSNSSNDLLQEMHETLTKMAKEKPASAPVPATTEVSENTSTVEEPIGYTQEELTKMLTSGKFEDLLTVATYPDSTESQLLFIAAYCAKSDLSNDETSVVQLASTIIDHPNATTTVMSTLAQCKSQIVWLLVAQSNLCSENTLAILASNYCGSYYSNNSDNILVAVAIAILENPSATEQIIDELEDNSNGLVENVIDIRFARITG